MLYSNEQRNLTMCIQELSAVDVVLEKYLGPIHPVRKELGLLLDRMRERLAYWTPKQ